MLEWPNKSRNIGAGRLAFVKSSENFVFKFILCIGVFQVWKKKFNFLVCLQVFNLGSRWNPGPNLRIGSGSSAIQIYWYLLLIFIFFLLFSFRKEVEKLTVLFCPQSWQELDQRLCSVSFLASQEDEYRQPLPADTSRRRLASEYRPASEKQRAPPVYREADKRASSEYRYRSPSDYNTRASESKSMDMNGSRRRKSNSSGHPTSPTPTGIGRWRDKN